MIQVVLVCTQLIFYFGNDWRGVFVVCGYFKRIYMFVNHLTPPPFQCNVSEEVTWRIALAFGAVPGLVVFGFRKNMQETAHFEDSKRRRVSYWVNARIAFKVFISIFMGWV